MKVYIFGYDGNMARRYRAILHTLGHETGGCDVDREMGFGIDAADAFIVATPTDTHAEILCELKDRGKPILCEKPLTKSVSALESLLAVLKKSGTRLEMVNQYAEIDLPGRGEETSYNCYRHGNDGLHWDCISLIRLARGPITLREDSPTWQCTLNGQKLRLGDVDQAYVTMIERWLKEPRADDFDELLAAHAKTAAMEAAACRAS